jgi:hypothetical protein
METRELIAEYRRTIEAVRVEFVRATDAPIALDSWERKLKLCKAELLKECLSPLASVEQARRDVGEVDGRLGFARETCRLLRLKLALTVSPSVLEVVA